MGPSISRPWQSDQRLGFPKSLTSLATTVAATGSSPRLGSGTESFPFFFLFSNGFPESEFWEIGECVDFV